MSPAGQRIVEAVGPRLAYAYIRFLRATMRVEYRGQDALARARATSGQYVLAFWHSRFVLMRYAYPDRRLVILSSRHRDSRMLAAVMRRFGLTQAWGSSTEAGAAGLRAVLRHVRDGFDVGITPDGPRGPRRRVQPGVVAIARLAGKPIVPVTFSARPARRLRSWDRTLLPAPFARGLFVYGEPVHVPRDADPAAQERVRAALEAELDRLTDAADRELGLAVEDARP
jgi:lysophospholipid acyltransferase (LPLAT)-like uncharacterized protein